ncbi:MAG: Protein translocase subunit SecA, partial [uncultured Acidimicrobiales bacterium]
VRPDPEGWRRAEAQGGAGPHPRHQRARAGDGGAVRRGPPGQDRRVPPADRPGGAGRRPAPRGLRHRPGGLEAGHRPAPLRRPADGRRGAALRVDRGDEDRRGQDPRVHAPRLPQRAAGLWRARHHRERLPRPVPRRVDGPHPLVARPHRGPHDPRHQGLGRQARQLRPGHHLRDQQRVRLRLPARQHGHVDRGQGPARAPVRHRRRDRLDPHRRGPHPAHHQRPPGRRRQALLLLRQHRPRPLPRRRLRRRRGEAPRRPPRRGDREGRGRPRRREPLRRAQLEPRA